jgi:hypothetical protein
MLLNALANAYAMLSLLHAFPSRHVLSTFRVKFSLVVMLAACS